MYSDVRLSEVAALWTASTAPAVIGWALLRRAFPGSPLGLWALSRTIGLLLWTYLAWIPAAGFGLAYTSGWAFFGGAALTVVGCLLLWRDAAGLTARDGREILETEALFGLFLVFTLAVAPLVGQLTPEGEHFMDYAFLKRLSISDSFPLTDPWLSGTALPYYHYGHVVFDVLRRISGLEVHRFFSYAVAFNYALFGIALYGSASLLSGSRRSAVVSSLLGLLAGNLAVWSALHSAEPVDWFQSARLLDGVITEFPLFWFAAGELHAHTMAAAPATAVLGLALALLASEPTRLHDSRAAAAVLLVLCLGALIPLHTWDFLTFGSISAAAAGLVAARRPRASRWQATALGLGIGVGVLVTAVLAYAPSSLGFGAEQADRGLGLVSIRSDTVSMLELWGAAFVALTVGLLPGSASAQRIVVPSGLVAVWVLAIGAAVIQPDAALGWMLPLGLSLGVAVHIRRDALATSIGRSWLLALAGLLGILAAECVYIDDLWEGASARMNTVFKVYGQVWILFSLALPVLVGYALRHMPRRVAIAGRVTVATALMASLGFLVLGVPNRLAGAENRGMDVRATFRGQFPYDAQAAEWIGANLDPDAVVLEAPGRAYDWRGRMAVLTGRPTLVGWYSHEAGWRNDWTLPVQRARDALQVYRDPSLDEAHSIASRYGVAYVFVGAQEIAAFGKNPEGLLKFDGWELVYGNPGARLYAVPREGSPASRARVDTP